MSDRIADVMEPVPGEPPRKPKGDLGVRTVSAVVMVAIAGTSLWFGGWLFSLFVIAVTVGLLWEWWGLSNRISQSLTGKSAWMLGGLVYIGLASFFLLAFGSADVLGVEDAAWRFVLPLILIVIATDTGAYFVGRAIGGPKIAPKISPSKTWAGLIGGVAAAGTTLYFWGQVYQAVSSDAVMWLPLVGGVLAIVAQAGDFFESWMKRKAGVKDSGSLIPGHGGLLDRVDGLLPVVIAAAGAIFVILMNSTDL